ncbi:hypothetical protein ANAPC1_01459 [Anaplasma phagocytophilum]|uniref:Uncharacterized protein n=1 Tax=Anaplasma phagocytophilum TaxID=948 RepID=A0AA45UUH4_ANAPH|nr:hypothetical protein ANAPC1_01459 [Anaplasma phagocytophilum]
MRTDKHVHGVVAAWAEEGLEELLHFQVRSGGSEEIYLVQGKEQWLCFAGPAVKRYPKSKVRETNVSWYLLQDGIRGQKH